MDKEMLQTVTNEELCAVIDSWIRGRNAERNRNILKLRLVHGRTFESLAEEVEMSVRQVKNIVYNGECTIYTKL